MIIYPIIVEILQSEPRRKTLQFELECKELLKWHLDDQRTQSIKMKVRLPSLLEVHRTFCFSRFQQLVDQVSCSTIVKALMDTAYKHEKNLRSLTPPPVFMVGMAVL